MILKNLTYNTLLRSMNIPADAEHVLGHHNCVYEVEVDEDGDYDELMVASDDDLIPPEHSRWMAQHELFMYSSQVKAFLHDMAARQASRGFGPKPMEYLQKLGFSPLDAARLCWDAGIRHDGICRAIWGADWNRFALPE